MKQAIFGIMALGLMAAVFGLGMLMMPLAIKMEAIWSQGSATSGVMAYYMGALILAQIGLAVGAVICIVTACETK